MIVLPGGFVLGQSSLGSQSLKNPRIGYQNWLRGLTFADVVVSSEDPNGPRDAILRPSTYEYWQPQSLPATLEVDLGTFRDVDYFGVVGTLGSSRAALLVETSNGTQSGSPLEYEYTQFSSEVLPANDAPLMFLDTSRSIRAFRLTVTGVGTMPKLAVVYAGRVLEMTEPIRGGGHAPMSLKRETILRRALSRGGQFLDQSIRRTGQMGSFTFEHLDPDWYRDNFDPFVLSARQYPFFFAWRPEEYPDEVAYAWNEGDIRPQYEGILDWMSVSLNLRGLGYE